MKASRTVCVPLPLGKRKRRGCQSIAGNVNRERKELSGLSMKPSRDAPRYQLAVYAAAPWRSPLDRTSAPTLAISLGSPDAIAFEAEADLNRRVFRVVIKRIPVRFTQNQEMAEIYAPSLH
ncbi:hypothetical protein E4U35_007347 [Claviceps purpurea]|nr:hypothetical protein E4U35_007347 [Claviceps purpurea]KAG6254970.1 hypothetical protein E4U49_007217 [Claviceps purpurea]